MPKSLVATSAPCPTVVIRICSCVKRVALRFEASLTHSLAPHSRLGVQPPNNATSRCRHERRSSYGVTIGALEPAAPTLGLGNVRACSGDTTASPATAPPTTPPSTTVEPVTGTPPYVAPQPHPGATGVPQGSPRKKVRFQELRQPLSVIRLTATADKSSILFMTLFSF